MGIYHRCGKGITMYGKWGWTALIVTGLVGLLLTPAFAQRPDGSRARSLLEHIDQFGQSLFGGGLTPTRPAWQGPNEPTAPSRTNAAGRSATTASDQQPTPARRSQPVRRPKQSPVGRPMPSAASPSQLSSQDPSPQATATPR